jgi:hypothetical protein
MALLSATPLSIHPLAARHFISVYQEILTPLSPS